jgi:hypothetical protein
MVFFMHQCWDLPGILRRVWTKLDMTLGKRSGVDNPEFGVKKWCRKKKFLK